MDRGIPKSIQADPGVVVDILHPADKLRVAPRNQSLFTCVDPIKWMEARWLFQDALNNQSNYSAGTDSFWFSCFLPCLWLCCCCRRCCLASIPLNILVICTSTPTFLFLHFFHVSGSLLLRSLALFLHFLTDSSALLSSLLAYFIFLSSPLLCRGQSTLTVSVLSSRKTHSSPFISPC